MFDFSAIFIEFSNNVGLTLGVIMVAIIALFSALVALNLGLRYFIFFLFGDGTTSSFSRALYSVVPSVASRWDRLTYRPYKGYNRLRSRAWNMKNTMQ